MTDGDALLHAIRENPGEDTPRLAYADWLDEQGPSNYAAFIRAQCEAAKPPSKEVPCCPCDPWGRMPNDQPCPCAWCEPRRRQRDLWSYSICDIADMPNGSWITTADWIYETETTDHGFNVALVRRGFVDEVRLPTAAFLKHAAGIFAHPITKVVLTDAEPLDEEDIPKAGFRWQGEYDWEQENAGGGTPTSVMGGLPNRLVRIMPYHRRYRKADKYLERVGEGSVRTYPTAQEALAVLSAACVQFGRAAFANNRSIATDGSAPLAWQ